MVEGSRVGIYRRISDDREGRELGIERQDEDCRALLQRLYAAKQAGELVDTYTDNDIGASTRSKKKRPDFERLLADVRAGRVNHVLAYTTSRLTRRPREFEDLIELAEKYGVTYDYVRSPSFDLNTSAGRRVARILAANDAGEAEDISERVQRAKQQAKDAGLWLGGGRPFGYEADGVTVRDSEARLIEDATGRVLAGESMRSIADEWNSAGVLTATGKQWVGNAVRDVLTRPRNVAQLGKTEPEGPAVWEAIVDREAWEALRAMVADRTREGHSTSRKLLGSFLFRCECGSVVNSGGTTKSGKYRYRCPKCFLQRVADEVDSLVLAVMEGDLRKNGAGLMPKPTSPVKPLRDRLTVLRRKAKDIAAEFGDPDSDMTREQFREANTPIQEKIKEITTELGRIQAGSVFSGVADAEDPVKAFRAAGQDRQRAIIRARWNVTLMRVGRGRRPFNPESVVIEPKS